MKIKMNTTEHSQMNDQIERLNQIMKQYLKCYVNYQQNNWVKLLLAVQFAYNNNTQTFTEISLFQAEYDRNMQINNKIIKLKNNNNMTIQQDKKMWQIHEQLKKDLQFVYKKMKIYYNLWYENIFTFKTKQKIYLSCKNFKTKQLCKKLDYQKMKAFKMKQQTELVTFELKLSKYSKIHFIIHIMLLESALKNAKIVKNHECQKIQKSRLCCEKNISKKSNWWNKSLSCQMKRIW